VSAVTETVTKVSKLPLPMQILYRALRYFAAKAARGGDIEISFSPKSLAFHVFARGASLIVVFDCEELGLPKITPSVVVCSGTLRYERVRGSFYEGGTILLKKTKISMTPKEAREFILDLKRVFYWAVDQWSVDDDEFVRVFSKYFGSPETAEG
jgi:preprotein translocase subunit Sec61beta